MGEVSSWPDRLPGASLGAALAEVDPAGLPDGELVDVLTAWRRQASWAQAGELAAVAELARRRESGSSRDAEFASAEVGLALAISPRSADAHLHLAQAVADRLPSTRAALAAGRIDLVKVRVIAQGTRSVGEETARAVEERVLPCAGKVTPGRLRARVERAVIALDPSGAERRRKASETDRRVECYDTGNGTAVFGGVHLPAGPAIAADNRLHGIATALKTDGDTRTLDQLSADVFLALLLGTHPASGLPTTELTATLAPAALNAATAAAHPGERGKTTGERGMYGDAASRGSTAGSRSVSGEATSCNTTGSRPASHGTALRGSTAGSRSPSGDTFSRGSTAGDHSVCNDPTTHSTAGNRPTPHETTPHRSTAGDRSALDNAASRGEGVDGRSEWTEVSRSYVASMDAGALGRAVGDRIGTVHLTVPLATLLGLSAEPGHAAGYGPLTAEVARQMASVASNAATRWCLTISGADGEPLHHGHLTYRPPPAMAHLVRTLQPTCRFPGCTRPSNDCDLDHRIPYNQGGPTCPCNLQPLCRRHHRTKQATGWTVAQHPTGIVWTTPAGKTYLTEAEQPPPTTPYATRRSPMEARWRRCLLDLPRMHRASASLPP